MPAGNGIVELWYNCHYFLIDPAANQIHIRWQSVHGLRCALLSNTDISAHVATWPVFNGLRNLGATPPASGDIGVERQIGVYRGIRRYRFGDVAVLPVTDFLHELHAGWIF
jgi:hypothetical protein